MVAQLYKYAKNIELCTLSELFDWKGVFCGKFLLYSIKLLVKKNPNSNLLFRSDFPFFRLASTNFTYVLLPTVHLFLQFFKTKCYPFFQIHLNFFLFCKMEKVNTS